VSEQKGIDTLALEFSKVREELTVLRDDLKQKENPTDIDQQDLHSVSEFVDHFENGCNKDDCEITGLKEDASKKWLVRGITLGKRLATIQ
jgi:hemerythrin-like domain-containing protein